MRDAANAMGQQQKRVARVLCAVILGLTCYTLAPIWAVEFPPLQDYPYHLLRAHIAIHYANADLPYAELFNRSFFPTGYILSDYLLVGLGAFLPLPVAGKAVLSLYVILFLASFFYFVRSVHRDGTIIGLFGFLFVLNWHFNKGFLNFLFSVPFFLFALGWWWRYRGELRRWRLAGFAGLVTLVFLGHLFSLVLLALAVGFLWLWTSRQKELLLRSALGFVPVLGLFLLGRLMRISSLPTSASDWLMIVPRPWSALRGLVRDDMPHLTSYFPHGESWILLSAGMLGLAVAALRWRHSLQSPFLALAGFFLLMLLFAPEHTRVFGFVAARVLLLGLLCGLAALHPPRDRRLRIGLSAAVVALAVAYQSGTLVEYRRLDAELVDFAAAHRQVPPGERVSFRIRRDLLYRGRHTPFAFAGGYYFIERGAGLLPENLGEFVGAQRIIADRQRQFTRSSPEDVAYLILRVGDPGDYAVQLGTSAKTVNDRIAEGLGYRKVLDTRLGSVYRREWIPPVGAPPARYFGQGNEDAAPFIVLYDPEPDWEEFEAQACRRTFSQGKAHLLACDDADDLVRPEGFPPISGGEPALRLGAEA